MRIFSFRIGSSVVAVTFTFLAAVIVLGAAGPFVSTARADDPQRAKELFQEGTRFFDLGQFDKAIDAWQSGYREKSDPGFLYNIAQAYRLAGDANKAIFFYKGYLRNSPKAHNRADVEQKIQALQKQASEQGQAPRATTPPAIAPGGGDSAHPATPPPAPPAPPPVIRAPATAPEPPPSTALPPATPGETAGADAGGATATVAVTAPPPLALDETRPLDFGLGVGIDGWSSGVQGKANASLALVLSGGYMLGHDPTASVRFRLGGALGYTFLKEATYKDTFLSALVVPTVLIRAGKRMSLFGELGVGVLGISGIKPNSVLLDPKLTLKINGTQGLLEVRPAVGLQYQLTHAVGLFGALAIDYTPKANHFYQAISRTELLLGMALRF